MAKEHAKDIDSDLGTNHDRGNLLPPRRIDTSRTDLLLKMFSRQRNNKKDERGTSNSTPVRRQENKYREHGGGTTSLKNMFARQKKSQCVVDVGEAILSLTDSSSRRAPWVAKKQVESSYLRTEREMRKPDEIPRCISSPVGCRP